MKRQSMVESILGRLITDVEFRHGFLSAPAEVSRAHALELSEDELDALARMDPVSLALFATCLDPKIVRAAGGTVAVAVIGRGRR